MLNSFEGIPKLSEFLFGRLSLIFYFGFSIMATSQQNLAHSVPKTVSGAIDLTKAERIAEGGTHILYRFAEAPFVIKCIGKFPA